MSKFSTSGYDGIAAGNFLREERTRVLKQVDQVVAACNSKDKKQPGADFLTKLSEYLNRRKNEIHFFSPNNTQMQSRSDFVSKLINITNTTEQLNMLDEKNIRRFKGFFTQRLYDILVARRTELEKSSISTKKRLDQ